MKKSNIKKKYTKRRNIEKKHTKKDIQKKNTKRIQKKYIPNSDNGKKNI